MGIKIKMNASQLEASIEQITKASLANGARSIRRIGDRALKLAQDYAPRDDGDLERAIRKEDFRDAKGRIGVIVYVDPDEPVTEKSENPSSDGKTVGDYALLMERGLAPYGSGAYQLDKSRAKAETGKDVGGRYMRRALKKAGERAVTDVKSAVAVTLAGRGNRRIVTENRVMSENDYGDGGEDE